MFFNANVFVLIGNLKQFLMMKWFLHTKCNEKITGQFQIFVSVDSENHSFTISITYQIISPSIPVNLSYENDIAGKKIVHFHTNHLYGLESYFSEKVSS